MRSDTDRKQVTAATETGPRGQEAEEVRSKMGTNHPSGEFVNMPQMVLGGGDTSGMVRINMWLQ
jgi:hypothetical protein